MESSSLLIAASQIIESLSDRVIERLKKRYYLGCFSNRAMTQWLNHSIS
jgi:hypothetical protein